MAKKQKIGHRIQETVGMAIFYHALLRLLPALTYIILETVNKSEITNFVTCWMVIHCETTVTKSLAQKYFLGLLREHDPRIFEIFEQFFKQSNRELIYYDKHGIKVF
jgi:hypothetical protein